MMLYIYEKHINKMDKNMLDWKIITTIQKRKQGRERKIITTLK